MAQAKGTPATYGGITPYSGISGGTIPKPNYNFSTTDQLTGEPYGYFQQPQFSQPPPIDYNAQGAPDSTQKGLQTTQQILGAASLIPGPQQPFVALGTLGLGAIQSYVAMKELNKLNKTPTPNYSITDYQKKSYGRAESMTHSGFTPAERQVAMGDISRSNNQSYLNAVNMSGGQGGQSIAAGINFGNLRALTDLAAKDAQLKRQNIRYADSIGAQLTNQENLITNTNIQNRIRKENAFGGALQAGTGNIARGIDANQMYSLTKNLYGAGATGA